MEHHIQPEQIGPTGEVMAHAVATCVHCGFCLAACPTYRLLGQEMDSPRGRIVLMKNVLEGALRPEDAAVHIDRCLGCVGCVPACPSGVPYGELLTAYRAHVEPKRSRPALSRLTRLLVRETLPYPARFRAAAVLGQFARPLRRVMPSSVGTMLNLLPSTLPAKTPPLPEVHPAIGERRARVALLTGCVQQVLAPAINWATLRVLAANGVEVVIPREQACCGALGMHTGDAEHARKLAAQNLRVFPRDVDAILSNAAGCGSSMKEYGLLFKGTPQEESAQAFAQKVQDVSEFLDALGARPMRPLPKSLVIAYQDACHLAHAQGVWGAPRRLLGMIPNLTVREIAEGDLCCGSAGTYNIEQPELADKLGERKVRNILATDAQAVATGNIGCLVQLRTHLLRAGSSLPVWHTMEVLAQAI